MRYVLILIVACIVAAVGYIAFSVHNKADLKSATSATPELREGTRHTFYSHENHVGLTNIVSNRVESDLKVGFVFSGKIGDYGFTYSQNQGRLALAEQMGIETVVVDEVMEDDSCLTAFERLVEDGCTIIFSCSNGFMKYAVEMAEKHPELYFIHCAGDVLRDNLSQYFGRIYQVRYLTGVVAGLRTQTNKVGYVAAFPIPQVVRGIDAFALGVKSVNPEARVVLQWSHVWYDPGKERELALALIDDGCDVIAQHQNSVAPQVAAEERGVWSIGYHSSMEFFAPKAYLTGASWNWTPYMINQIEMVQSGTWHSTNYWGGIEDNMVMLDPLTANVAPGTSEAVDKAIAAIKDGFDIFVGPLYDNNGALRVPDGHVLTDAEKLAMDWLVDNVVIVGDMNNDR